MTDPTDRPDDPRFVLGAMLAVTIVTIGAAYGIPPLLSWLGAW